MADQQNDKQQQGRPEQAPRRPMLHRVLNHAEHDFHQGRTTIRKVDGKEEIHSAAAMPWIVIPRAGIRTVKEKNAKTGKEENVRKMTPGEAVLDDEQLAFLKASPVCKHWLENDPVTNRPQVVVVESYPAPADKTKAA